MAVLITLGNRTDLILDDKRHLLISQTVAGQEGLGGYHWEKSVVDLGPLTPERANNLKNYIDQLVELI